MVKYMLATLMDGIKDTNMMMDYAMECVDDPKSMTWFKNHAKTRLDMATSDYNYIVDNLGLNEKIRSGDEMADALVSHLQYEMKELNSKYSMI